MDVRIIVLLVFAILMAAVRWPAVMNALADQNYVVTVPSINLARQMHLDAVIGAIVIVADQKRNVRETDLVKVHVVIQECRVVLRQAIFAYKLI